MHESHGFSALINEYIFIITKMELCILGCVANLHDRPFRQCNRMREVDDGSR